MIHFNDTDFDVEAIREHRKLIIALRDKALVQNDFEWAVILSITVGLLAALAEKEEKENAGNAQ